MVLTGVETLGFPIPCRDKRRYYRLGNKEENVEGIFNAGSNCRLKNELKKNEVARKDKVLET